MTEDTQQAIAEDLGVSPQTLGRSIDELQDSGKLVQVNELNTDEKREQVREFVEDNPTTPGPGGRFHRFYSLLLSEIQRGGVRRGVAPRPVVRR